jgi:hypothetical protein
MTLEQEILEKFQQLSHDAQSRMLMMLSNIATQEFDELAWWDTVETLQNDIKARIGHDSTTGALGLLDELREESS